MFKCEPERKQMKKILIVDDTRLMRNIIKNTLLEDDTYTIFEAKNGQDAVESYKSNRPHVVTMDITMETKNGVEAARDILSFDRHAKIVMVTSLGQEKLMHDCIEAGVKDFIVKPFSKARIKAIVARILCSNSLES